MRIEAAERRTLTDDERELMRVVRSLRAIALTGVLAGIGLIAIATVDPPAAVADEGCPQDAVDMAAPTACSVPS